MNIIFTNYSTFLVECNKREINQKDPECVLVLAILGKGQPNKLGERLLLTSALLVWFAWPEPE
jgi:hypothetical protein